MRIFLTCVLFLSAIFVSALEAGQIVYVPRSSYRDYFLSFQKNLVVTKDGKKHSLNSAKMGANYNYLYEKFEIDLDGCLTFALDSKILTPGYDYKRDKSRYYCHSLCKGRFKVFIPAHDISEIIFKNSDIAKIFFKDKREPIFAYKYPIKISGEEDLGAFGSGEFKAEIGRFGDSVIIPDFQNIDIKAKSSLTAIVTLNDGTKRQLTDFRPTEFILTHNESTITVPTKNIKTIEIEDGSRSSVLCDVQLKTGDKKSFEIDNHIVGLSGVIGKGKDWYEGIQWDYLERIDFE